MNSHENCFCQHLPPLSFSTVHKRASLIPSLPVLVVVLSPPLEILLGFFVCVNGSVNGMAADEGVLQLLGGNFAQPLQLPFSPQLPEKGGHVWCLLLYWEYWPFSLHCCWLILPTGIAGVSALNPPYDL